jgi:uncharacterized protein YggL (DUF469 family)
MAHCTNENYRPRKYGFGGGLAVGSLVGGYLGYKIGRAVGTRKGGTFDTEKKIGRGLKKTFSKKKKFSNGGLVGNIFTEIIYRAILSTENSSDIYAQGNDLDKIRSEYNSISAMDFDNPNSNANSKILESRIYQYEFIGDDTLNAEDYIDDLQNTDYWNLIDIDIEDIDSDSVFAINKSTDEMIDEIRDFIKQEYNIGGRYAEKYMTISVFDESGEFIADLNIRTTDHSQNARNNDNTSYNLSFVIANKNATEGRFIPLGMEYYFDENTDIEYVKEAIKGIIDEKIEYIKEKGKKYAEGGMTEHGLRVGDKIMGENKELNSVFVKNNDQWNLIDIDIEDIDSDSVFAINKSTDEMIDEIRDFIKQEYNIGGRYAEKYMTISVFDESGEFIADLNIRTTDHSQNARNNDNTSYNLSFVIANKNATEGRFIPLGMEYYFDENTDIEYVKEAIKGIIDEKIEYIKEKGKKYAEGGSTYQGGGEINASLSEQKKWSDKQNRLYDLYANHNNEIVDLKEDLLRAKNRKDKEEIKVIERRIKNKKYAINFIKQEFYKDSTYQGGGGISDFGIGDKVMYNSYKYGTREGKILREIDDKHFEIGSGFGVSMVHKDKIIGYAPKRMFGLFEQGGNIDDIVAG